MDAFRHKTRNELYANVHTKGIFVSSFHSFFLKFTFFYAKCGENSKGFVAKSVMPTLVLHIELRVIHNPL